MRDVLSLTAGDRRIQTYFTCDVRSRSVLAAGVDEALAELGAPVLPWRDAVGSRFDLALAASENDRLADLDAPVLLVPHGAGHQKFYPGTAVVSGLNPERLVVGGRVVPAAIGLPHAAHLDRLAQACPPAASRGVVVGDPALARMRGSRFRAGQLRAAFGARDKRLVVVASTFGPESALGRVPDLPERLVGGLPVDEYQVVVVLHPGVWAAHGTWQVRSWLGQATAYGVQVVTPYEGWQAALLAASIVVSDHGSLALYAAALDTPVVLVGRGSAVTVPGSAAALLAKTAPVWDVDQQPRDQIDTVLDQHRSGVHGQVMDLLAEPDPHGEDCARRLRRVVYGLLRLEQPTTGATFGPVVPPAVSMPAIPATVVGAAVQRDGVRIERYADLGHGEPRGGLEHRHLVADLRTASLAQLCAASVVVVDERAAWSTKGWPTRAADEVARWPQARVLATVVDEMSCAIWAGGQVTLLRADEPLDPIVLASLAYVRLTTLDRIPAEDRVHLGRRVIRVAAVAR
ncbi:hypothetical protein [Micromonospora sp. WMMD1082]|uniref:hypothetical protein n=1 Tax=Micromonospora sp. WMMD1082 TaxID=3016104 RepID=UPI002415D33E|nr:hypothetical protein [Micromonospora sp. WMMD1082]MDG4798423.1 hypothetical protein [Micromonospora sp. WMMD1082]